MTCVRASFLVVTSPLDRSQSNREKSVATALQRRSYRLRTDELAEAHPLAAFVKASRDRRYGALEVGRPNGRSLSISALSAASIVRYDASTAITRDPASAIQPVWPTRSISAHCSESSRAPRVELVPLIICAARRMLGTSAPAPASRTAARTGGGSSRALPKTPRTAALP